MARSEPLRTPRLCVESFSIRHLTSRYVSWLNDPGVTRFSENRYTKHTLASCGEYAAQFEAGANYLWAIVAHDPHVGHVGNINAYIAERHALADIGILIGEPAAWGKGYGTEAWLAVCDYLFRRAGIEKISAGTLDENTGMLRIMERAHMQPDGIRAAHYVVDGSRMNLVHMAVFREAWLQRFPSGPFAS